MRVLLVMNTPGFLRYYDETVDELLACGHEVLLGFTDPRLRAEALEILSDRQLRPRVLGEMPPRADRYAGVASDLRSLADFARYLDPRYARASFLRDRLRVRLHRRVTGRPLAQQVVGRLLADRDTLPRPVVRALVRTLLAVERALPSAPDIEERLRGLELDVVLVTPLVTAGSSQTDYVKSARAIGVPCGLCVASWDNLTNKGLIREVPDRIFVWNEAQKREAVQLHGAPPDRVVVTGAQSFDRWFGRRPSVDRDAFCARLGLDPARPIVLFAGSTSNIADPAAEDRFARRWAQAVRAAADPVLAAANILVRPHPDRRGSWSDVDLDGLEHAIVWPRERPNSVTPEARAEYFDSLHHAAAVVGINTSAMIEAAIVDRPVLTVHEPQFAQAHEGTLHFAHLLPENGGHVHVAATLEEHARQLASDLRDARPSRARNARFVGTFIRPHGVDRPATPVLVEAVAALGQVRPVAVRGAPPLRWVLALQARHATRVGPPPGWRAEVAELRRREALRQERLLKVDERLRRVRLERLATRVERARLQSLESTERKARDRKREHGQRGQRRRAMKRRA